MASAIITPEEFLDSIKEFENLSKRCYDTWKVNECIEVHKCYIQKEEFIKHINLNAMYLWKAEYVIFYNLSYGVPSFSFNIWNSDGSLLSLDEIRDMSPSIIGEQDFYSIVTQQEHPIFNKPYFIIHPCHTESLLSTFKNTSKNIIVTFLSLITPIVKIHLPLEYGL